MNEETSLRIVYQKGDDEYLKEYIKRVSHLVDFTIEIIDKQPQALLSQVFRDSLSRIAHEVDDMHTNIKYKLCIDNPSKPLE